MDTRYYQTRCLFNFHQESNFCLHFLLFQQAEDKVKDLGAAANWECKNVSWMKKLLVVFTPLTFIDICTSVNTANIS